MSAELSGHLNFLSLADLLQLFGSNGHSGILRLKSKYAPETGVVYLKDGNPIDALAIEKTGPEALYSLFGWTEGEFEFRREAFDRPVTVKQSRMEIILDGMRKLDDGEIERLGPASGTPEEAAKRSREGASVIRGPLVDYVYIVDEEFFPSGQDLVEEGKHGNWIWVILEGSAEVLRNTPKGPVKLLTIGEGAFIGSVESFLFRGGVRSASVRSITSVQLGVLDTQRLAIDFSPMSHELKELIVSIDRRLKRVTDTLLLLQSGKNPIREFMSGKESVMPQGPAEARLYRITQGDACLVRRIPKGNVPLQLLKKGDVFGYLPFIAVGHEPNSASVFGSADLKVIHLDVQALQAEYERQSQTFRNIMDHTASAIAATTRLVCAEMAKL